MASQPPSELCVTSISRLRLAVATAIIRCKPTQMTAKEFAESLGQRLRKRQLDWKGRAEKLEMDLLKTRQELALARLRETGQYQEEEFGMDWDTTGTEFGQDHPVLEPSTACPELAFPTPPSSIPTEQASHQNTLENHLRSSTQFLHSVTRLKSLSDLLEHTSSTHVDTLNTMRDSAVAGMECLMKYVSIHLHDDGLPWKLMNDAVSGVVRMLECYEAEEIRQELVEGVMKLVEGLLQLVLHNHHLNDHFTQRQLCSLLVSLSTSPIIGPLILRVTLTHIQTVAAMLHRSLASNDFDPTLYENGCYLLSVMEDTLLSSRTVPSTHTRVDNAGMRTSKDIVDGLEDCLLHISNDFPLFCQQVWRVVSILDWMRFSKSEGQVDKE